MKTAQRSVKLFPEWDRSSILRRHTACGGSHWLLQAVKVAALTASLDNKGTVPHVHSFITIFWIIITIFYFHNDWSIRMSLTVKKMRPLSCGLQNGIRMKLCKTSNKQKMSSSQYSHSYPKGFFWCEAQKIFVWFKIMTKETTLKKGQYNNGK